MDADFIVSLKHIPSLWVEEDPRDIECQFNRYIALIERSLSVVPRLDNNDFGSLETTRRAIYNELRITFNALGQLEKSHQKAKEKALDYWLDAESFDENLESKNKVQKAISSFYENRHKLITMFRIKIAETMVKYFDEQIKPNSNSLYLIRMTLPESNRWRRRIESNHLLAGTQVHTNVVLPSSKKELTHPQRALLLIYNNEELPETTMIKLRNVYNRLNRPGTIGDRERQCTGSSKRSLTQRLRDLEIVQHSVKSEDGRLKLERDREAIKKDYDDR